MNLYYNEDSIVYLNGSFIKASEAKIDLYSQSLHYGYSVFEGIRSYKTAEEETKIFKAAEHYNRLKQSAELLNMPYPWNTQDLVDITYEVLRMNKLQDAYIRPLVYAPANMSFGQNEESFIVIEAWEMPLFYGEKLLNVMSSTYQRPNPKGFKVEAKVSGHYVNSILANHEAKACGYDEALLNDINGFVAEAPGANLFYEKDGRLFTPALGNILPGITRDTVIEICIESGIDIIEKQITTDELLQADTAFFCGTAAEIIGIKSLDGKAFPMEWNNSKSKIIQEAYKHKVMEI